MEFVQRNKDKAITVGKAEGLRGNLAVERKALDNYAADLGLGLTKSKVPSLLKITDGAEPPEKYFADTYLNQALKRN